MAFTEIYLDESQESACRLLANAHGNFSALNALLTDNSSAFRSRSFKAACQTLGLKQRFTRPYRPQSNGKAERFIQSALREWGYGFVYKYSDERLPMLHEWNHHYNWHLPHQGIGRKAPISRFSISPNNLLQLHSQAAAFQNM